MGIVWEAYHKGVPWLGVPENPTDWKLTGEDLRPINRNIQISFGLTISISTFGRKFCVGLCGKETMLCFMCFDMLWWWCVFCGCQSCENWETPHGVSPILLHWNGVLFSASLHLEYQIFFDFIRVLCNLFAFALFSLRIYMKKQVFKPATVLRHLQPWTHGLMVLRDAPPLSVELLLKVLPLSVTMAAVGLLESPGNDVQRCNETQRCNGTRGWVGSWVHEWLGWRWKWHGYAWLVS